MATISDVAKRAGVSTGTVSNVIRGTAHVRAALKERVHAAISELDYHPNELARSLKVKQTYMLGMLLPDITNPFFPEIIRGAEEEAFERGYLLVAANTDERIERERRVIAALRSRRVDGILLASAPGEDKSHIRGAMEAGIPIVCLDRAVPDLTLDCILLDNVRGAQECIRQLIRVGYDEIAIITGALQLQVARERLQGYEEALREVGLPVKRDLIVEGNFRRESGYRLGKELLLRRSPRRRFLCRTA
jgi:LacI family transcriptional regulator